MRDALIGRLLVCKQTCLSSIEARRHRYDSGMRDKNEPIEQTMVLQGLPKKPHSFAGQGRRRQGMGRCREGIQPYPGCATGIEAAQGRHDASGRRAVPSADGPRGRRRRTSERLWGGNGQALRPDHSRFDEPARRGSSRVASCGERHEEGEQRKTRLPESAGIRAS